MDEPIDQQKVLDHHHHHHHVHKPPQMFSITEFQRLLLGLWITLLGAYQRCDLGTQSVLKNLMAPSAIVFASNVLRPIATKVYQFSLECSSPYLLSTYH